MSVLVETPDRYGAYPRLSDAQIETLTARGERRRTQTDEVLIREGDAGYDFFVILAGKVANYEAHGTRDERLISVHGPRRFLGELSLFTGQTAFFTSVVAEPGDVLDVSADQMREAAVQDPGLGDLILRAYLIRRSILIGLGAGIRIIGSRFSPDIRRLREFAARNRLPYRWIDLENDRQAEELLRQLGVEPGRTPVVICPGGQVLRNPSNADLARVVGLPTPHMAEATCDLAIVGSGPAGLAAAVYGASEGLVTIALDAVATGGQAGTSSKIENYLGFPAGISGGELAERAVLQAEKFGASFNIPAEAKSLETREDGHVIRFADGSELTARAVLVATGARYRRLPVLNLEKYEKTNVYYAATTAEALMCRNDPVAVVGGGNSAGQATLFLSRYATQIRLIIRHEDLDRDMSRYLVDRILRLPNVEILRQAEVRELLGRDTLEGILVEDKQTGEHRIISARALFVFIGAEPCTGWLAGKIALDGHGFVLTGRDNGRGGSEGSALLETSQPGVFAAGDVRYGSIKRVASAVGEGAMAVRFVWEYLHKAGRAEMARTR
ncbi:FAD-dependent oxidoreductase [Planosporangium flavigriseum]|uniref:Thioredoxin reductase n=1 Tax=Planosporangium flavigriseum TaxID=373681 RepID=A0A8J3PJB5_9ACTN|nr:FAD-dependent oxidoreductase [Planosporangium flavigriseum]NJC65028.1 FAD-dependent oxidoreductase [Planosporangium flavigriseum]GIG71642.1 thioredoxin reductase [Planosporangium flavigriseum]